MSEITLVKPRKRGVHIAATGDPNYQWSFHDGFFDVTGADNIEIVLSDAIHGEWPVIHIAVSRGKNDVAQLRVCRIKGKISVRDTRRKPRK